MRKQSHDLCTPAIWLTKRSGWDIRPPQTSSGGKSSASKPPATAPSPAVSTQSACRWCAECSPVPHMPLRSKYRSRESACPAPANTFLDHSSSLESPPPSRAGAHRPEPDSSTRRAPPRRPSPWLPSPFPLAVWLLVSCIHSHLKTAYSQAS